ncbi:hypothetical protein COLO4_02736 [Corchorus olitorius]|uniref:Uncharacterized protein n=1 Tax=Corchorus olitorius TaxID=93759 RepID=A0A1R3L0H7_9ROSI|nr:hypothetical protein COLO4_02736 [Corchorus olitorius]
MVVVCPDYRENLVSLSGRELGRGRGEINPERERVRLFMNLKRLDQDGLRFLRNGGHLLADSLGL